MRRKPDRACVTDLSIRLATENNAIGEGCFNVDASDYAAMR